MNEHPTELLSAYVDGDLDTGTADRIAAHVAACTRCGATVADMQRLRSEVAAWAAEAPAPASDLWPGIKGRLEPRVPLSSPVSIDWYRRRWTVGIAELAIAATLVAALAAALSWRGAPVSVPGNAEPVPVLAQIEPTGAPDVHIANVGFADAQFDAAVNDLERVLREQRDQLNPRTVIVLERNLRVIDDAIGEARAALAQDPANTLLNAHLADARRKKLDLLRRAALITEGD